METEKKKMSKGTKVLLIIACVILIIALLMVATVVILDKLGQNSLTDDGSDIDVSDKAEVLENGTVRYNGKLYRYNDQITTILFMGVDEWDKPQNSVTYGKAEQADVNVMAVLDPVNSKLTLISVSRDTMCDIQVLDDAGNYLGTDFTQLALSYSYGDGKEKSCELTSQAVSGIFHGIKIPAYGSISINGILDLLDLVGGVTITPTESFGPFTQGQPINIQGKLAEEYVRLREHTTEGNNQRMQHHNQVILALVNKALSMAREDLFSIPELYQGVSRNVTTNVGVSKMVYLAKIAIGLNLDSQIYKVQGESVLGEGNHAEFMVDEDALMEMIINVFYVPAE